MKRVAKVHVFAARSASLIRFARLRMENATRRRLAAPLEWWRVQRVIAPAINVSVAYPIR